MSIVLIDYRLLTIARLLVDGQFRADFEIDPRKTVDDADYKVTDEQLESIRRTQPELWNEETLVEIDARLQMEIDPTRLGVVPAPSGS